MEEQALEVALQVAHKKNQVFTEDFFKSFTRSIIAGMFIGFGVIMAFKTAGYFYSVQSPLTIPVAAFTFGTAILLIAYAGGDLFTGNAFYFTYAALHKKMSWLQVMKLWFGSYGGNLIGSICFALMILASGLLKDDSANRFLFAVVEKKTNAPFIELLFRGILCNWLICLAFYIPMGMKNDGPKIFIMLFLVFCFFSSGYEHSIANMCTFSVALLIDHPDTISLTGVINNLIPVTLGNLIGGVVFMGLVYWYLNRSQSPK